MHVFMYLALFPFQIDLTVCSLDSNLGVGIFVAYSSPAGLTIVSFPARLPTHLSDGS